MWRGHKIELKADHYIYSDTKQLVSDAPERACGHCGLSQTPEGHDGCLGSLPGVMNACCGHGVESEAYIQYRDGNHITGREALTTRPPKTP